MVTPDGSPASHERDRLIAQLARKRHGILTWEQALELGATPRMIQHRLAAGRWERVHRGVYRIAGAPETWRQALLAACLSCNGVASHRAAGALWQFPGFDGGVLEVTIERGSWCRLPGVVAHELKIAATEIQWCDAIPITKPARTLVDLASCTAGDDLAIAVDDAVRRKLVSITQLEQAFQGRRHGSAALRSVLQARSGSGPGPQSALETKVHELLLRSGFGVPACQYPVRDRGRIVAVVDFAYPERRLAVEADGYRWHSGRGQWQRDLSRRNRLTALGWHVVHVTWEDLKRDRHAISESLQRTLRGW